jgi:hypothetical protein
VPWPVTGKHTGREIEVLRESHIHEMGRQVEHERGIQFSTLHRSPALQQRTEFEAEDVDHLNRGLIGPDGAERLQMCLAGLRGKDQEFSDSCPLLPRLDKFIHDTVKGAAPQRGTAGERPHCRVDAVLDRWRPGDTVCR